MFKDIKEQKMLNRYLTIPLIVGSTIALIGCGGGSGSGDTTTTTVTGQFVDTYVGGLDYNCSSGRTGVTNSDGEYTCNIGDTVSFYVGSYLLGSASASSGILTPDVLYPDNPEAALNVAQLLQTLDSNSTDDIITIPENFTALDDVNATPTDADFDALMETELGEALVSEVDAQTHLDESELYAVLAGNTFYGVDVNDSTYGIATIVFNADLTSSTFTDSEGSGTEVLSVEGDKLYIGSSGEYHTIAEVMDTYILVNDYFPAEPDGQTRLYFTQGNAQVYFDSLSTSAATPTPMIGAWSYAGTNSDDPLNINVVVLNNSDYYFAQGRVGDGGVAGGIEVGNFTLSGNAVTIGSTPAINTNAGDTAVGSTLTYNSDNDTLSIDGTGIVMTRNKVTTAPWVGAWNVTNPAETDGIDALLTLDANGTYMVSNVEFSNPTIAAEADDPNGLANVFEMGTYSVVPVDATNYIDITFRTEAARDFNEQYGFSDSSGVPLRFDVSNYPNITFIKDGNVTSTTLSRVQADNITVYVP